MLARRRPTLVWRAASWRSYIHTLSDVTRLSKQYLPTLKPESIGTDHVESVGLLIRGGYIRQSSSGLFSLLPLGLKVAQKIKNVVDEEMRAIHASKLEMPSLLSSALWQKSGRLDAIGEELYRVTDRRDSEFVLAPTCEEEVTKLVGEEVRSWRDLPVRVYQITTKYRDETRPKSGLLRTKSFLMKDLYTFDPTLEDARETYLDVTKAYTKVLNKLFDTSDQQWHAVQAETGAMGGSHSHEFQVPDALGEDEIVKCSSCSYAANIEKAKAAIRTEDLALEAGDVRVILYGTQDLQQSQSTLYAFLLSKDRIVDTSRCSALLSEADAEQVYPSHSNQTWDWKDRPEGPLVRFEKLKIVLDEECKALEADEMQTALLRAIERFGSQPDSSESSALTRQASAPQLHDYFPRQGSIVHLGIAPLRHISNGDRCSQCNHGTLNRTRSIEVGHTFLLGTRYSQSLGYTFAAKDQTQEYLQMGCFGIGISRLIGVLAQGASRRFQNTFGAAEGQAVKKRREGFAWSSVVAPYKALIILQRHDDEAQLQAARAVSDALREKTLPTELTQVIGDAAFTSSDIAIDDRPLRMGEKLNAADLLGAPVTFIIGKELSTSGSVELRFNNDGKQVVARIPISSF